MQWDVSKADGSAASVRRVLKSFVQRVEVRKTEGTLHYTFPLGALDLPPPVDVEGTPGATRTRAHGFGGRCSIRLSYGGTTETILAHISPSGNPGPRTPSSVRRRECRDPDARQ